MLLTIKDVSAWLNIKPSTLYLWVAQGKIPCQKIHGLIRFDREKVIHWLESFDRKPPTYVPVLSRTKATDIDHLIEAAKRDAYTPRGETRPTASPSRKEEENGAR
jgi:excisionase family DNA binding protein